MNIEDRFIWPMGAELPKQAKLDLLWDDKNYGAEEKLDGERITAVVTSKGQRLYTRSASDTDKTRPIEITHRWPQIAQVRFTGIPIGTVLDGEGFSKLRRAEEIAGLFNYRSETVVPEDIKFIVFDCVFWGEQSLEEIAYEVRRKYVAESLRIANNPHFLATSVVTTDKKAFFEHIINSGGEGVVLKLLSGKYFQGKKPANIWVKAKKKDTFDCIITGFKPGTGKYKNLVGSVQLSQYCPTTVIGETVEYELVAVCYASGITDALRKDMTLNPTKYLGRVAVVDAYERVPNSVNLKQPRIKHIRPEGSKDPRECIVED